jgi:polyribonucleotide nucleotidyltransferase
VIGTGGKVIREIVEKTGAEDQHRGRRLGQGRLRQRRIDQGRDQLDQVDRLRSGSRPHLRGHRREGHGLRRLRELLRRQGRAGAHQPAGAAPREQGHDVVKEGDKVKVKLLGVDERGKVRLSMKAVDQTTGEDIEGKQRPRRRSADRPRKAAPRSNRATHL